MIMIINNGVENGKVYGKELEGSKTIEYTKRIEIHKTEEKEDESIKNETEDESIKNKTEDESVENEIERESIKIKRKLKEDELVNVNDSEEKVEKTPLKKDQEDEIQEDEPQEDKKTNIIYITLAIVCSIVLILIFALIISKIKNKSKKPQEPKKQTLKETQKSLNEKSLNKNNNSNQSSRYPENIQELHGEFIQENSIVSIYTQPHNDQFHQNFYPSNINENYLNNSDQNIILQENKKKALEYLDEEETKYNNMLNDITSSAKKLNNSSKKDVAIISNEIPIELDNKPNELSDLDVEKIINEIKWIKNTINQSKNNINNILKTRLASNFREAFQINTDPVTGIIVRIYIKTKEFFSTKGDNQIESVNSDEYNEDSITNILKSINENITKINDNKKKDINILHFANSNSINNIFSELYRLIILHYNNENLITELENNENLMIFIESITTEWEIINNKLSNVFTAEEMEIKEDLMKITSYMNSISDIIKTIESIKEEKFILEKINFLKDLMGEIKSIILCNRLCSSIENLKENHKIENTKNAIYYLNNILILLKFKNFFYIQGDMNDILKKNTINIDNNYNNFNNFIKQNTILKENELDKNKLFTDYLYALGIKSKLLIKELIKNKNININIDNKEINIIIDNEELIINNIKISNNEYELFTNPLSEDQRDILFNLIFKNIVSNQIREENERKKSIFSDENNQYQVKKNIYNMNIINPFLETILEEISKQQLIKKIQSNFRGYLARKKLNRS